MTDLVEKRVAICKECPLYKDTSYGAVCDSNKFINKEGDVSYITRPGYIRGCNCILVKKAANPTNHCIVNKW